MFTNESEVVVADTLTFGEKLWSIGQYVHLIILLLGLVTNTAVLLILYKRRIGSKWQPFKHLLETLNLNKIGLALIGDTTRTILIFLAVADIGSLLCNFFISLVPESVPLWFDLHWKTESCGLADVVISAVLTSSSWYIVMVTIERFTVVFRPLQAKIFYTRQRTIIACSATPLIWTIFYSWFGTLYVGETEDGHSSCGVREDKEALFSDSYILWAVLYFFVPAVVIVTLNSAIILRIRSVSRLTQAVLEKHNQINMALRYNPNEAGTAGVEITSTANESYDRLDEVEEDDSSERDDVRRQNTVRRSTKLVLAASITFVILMLPRGISFCVSVSHNDSGDLGAVNKAHKVLHTLAWWLQYLNHSTNFFVYVLANRRFWTKSS